MKGTHSDYRARKRKCRNVYTRVLDNRKQCSTWERFYWQENSEAYEGGVSYQTIAPHITVIKILVCEASLSTARCVRQTTWFLSEVSAGPVVPGLWAGPQLTLLPEQPSVSSACVPEMIHAMPGARWALNTELFFLLSPWLDCVWFGQSRALLNSYYFRSKFEIRKQ